MQALHPVRDAVSEAWKAETAGCICLLEAIRDPGNLGTVIRTAAAMGIGAMILSADCADLYHPRTVRAAMGALFTQRIIRVGRGMLPEVIGGLRDAGRRVFATALHQDALRLGEVALRQGDCVVIGNEGHGLTEETVAACDACMIIPMQEGSESLNAATAAAICMWELSCTKIGGAHENG
jgi:TrmH family RNA methyltransferase